MRPLQLVAIGVAMLACGHPAPAPAPAAAWVQRFAEHDGVRIEYRVREGHDGLPVVLVPGMTGDASDYERADGLVAVLGHRTLIAISLRGRGNSASPATGWTPADHHRDIAAVIEAEHLHRYHLIGHSMGVAYGLGFALSRPQGEIASFVAADYFPAVMQVDEHWMHMVDDKPGRHYAPLLGANILREQGAVDYADRLDAFTVPVLVILGTRSMDPGVETRWAKAPHHRVLRIEHGHDTFTNRAANTAIGAHLAAVERQL